MISIESIKNYYQSYKIMELFEKGNATEFLLFGNQKIFNQFRKKFSYQEHCLNVPFKLMKKMAQIAQDFQTKEVIIRKIVDAITGNAIADEIKEINNNVVESSNEGHNYDKNSQ